MQVDKYLYMISEKEIMYSSWYAKILKFRLRQTGQEVLHYCEYLRHTKILEDVNVYVEQYTFSIIIFILMQTAYNYIQAISQLVN